MMATEVIMAMAVDSAATNTAVRRREDTRLRDASIASTPSARRSNPEKAAVSPLTKAGMANADAPIISSAAIYPKNGLPMIGGAKLAAAPDAASSNEIHKSRIWFTRAACSRSPRAIASTGGTNEASRAGAAAETSATPMPTSKPNATALTLNSIGAGRLLT